MKVYTKESLLETAAKYISILIREEFTNISMDQIEIEVVDMPNYGPKAWVNEMIQGRSFKLQLNQSQINSEDNEYSFEEIISHEMVHIQQFVDGRVSTFGGVFWEGKDYTQMYQGAMGIALSTGNKTAYKALPWEAEAFKRQGELSELLEECFMEVAVI